AGNDQSDAAGEQFLRPVTVLVRDLGGAPLAGVPVTFTATNATVGAPGPVPTDAAGLASTTVTANAAGGAATGTAVMPGIDANATAHLFANDLSVAASSNAAVVAFTVTNASPAPLTVPYVILLTGPNTTPLQTVIGPICTNPLDPSTLAFEDSIGW